MGTTHPTARTRVRRKADRGTYERPVIDQILDESLFCHLAWVDDGSPRLIPTIHARVGDVLYLHGSRGSSTARALKEGTEICVSATVVDGIVLARSSPHHSMNYRSVVVYGRAREVTDRHELLAASRAITDHVVPGRSADARQPNDDDLRETILLALPIEEASAKIRTGPPVDDEADYELPVWAGVLPLRLVAGEPEADPRMPAGRTPPAYLTAYRRPGGTDKGWPGSI